MRKGKFSSNVPDAGMFGLKENALSTCPEPMLWPQNMILTVERAKTSTCDANKLSFGSLMSLVHVKCHVAPRVDLREEKQEFVLEKKKKKNYFPSSTLPNSESTIYQSRLRVKLIFFSLRIQ